jgi:excisionase family DNA binding protein
MDLHTDRLYSEREMMKLLKISRSTIMRWRNEGLPHKRLNGRTVRYSLEEVTGWIKHFNQGGSNGRVDQGV